MEARELLDSNFTDMEKELVVSNNQTCRDIAHVFNDEVEHFNTLLLSFKDYYGSITREEIDVVTEDLKEKFKKVEVMLVDDYQERFEKNRYLLSTLMHDFYLKDLDAQSKMPTEKLNKYLNEICRFDFFLIEDKIENDIMDFKDNFDYRYINNDDARVDFDHLMKNVEHTLICNLKRVIGNAVDDKQDIVSRYNTQAKEIIKNNRHNNFGK